MLIGSASEPQGGRQPASYAAGAFVGLFAGYAMQSVIWQLLALAGTPFDTESSYLVRLGLIAAFSLGGMWVAGERRRRPELNPGAFASVLTYFGWALFGAWVGSMSSAIIWTVVLNPRSSGLAGFAALVLVLAGILIGAIVARFRLSE